MFLVYGSIIPAKAQSCPSGVNGFQLVRSTYAGWTVNNLSCKPRDEGGTMCWIVCAYSNPATRDGFYTQAMWYTVPSLNGPYYKEMCNAAPPANTLSNTAKQVKAFWGDTGSDFEVAAARAVAQNLFALGESQATACPPPPEVKIVKPKQLEPECSPGNPAKPAGRVRSPEGKVEIRSYALEKWKGPITSEFPVFPCDWVRTGDRSSATVFIYTPSGAEDRIDMSSDTILEIPGRIDLATSGSATQSEGFVTDLIQGTIRWLTPETEIEQRRRERSLNSPFNVRTPTLTVGTRGTDFVLTHDASAKKDYLLLNSGKLEVAAGGKSILLGPGQQLFTENKILSAIYELRPEVWNDVIVRKTIPGPNLFANAKQIATVSPDKSVSTAKTGLAGGAKADSARGTRFNVLFRGRGYNTLYERSDHEGTPIDVYFFEIIGPNGLQAEQDGAKLWGRFVRYPAFGLQIKSETIWWYVDWIFKSGRWEAITSKGESFEVLGPVK